MGRHFHLGNNKKVFDAETFAIYQAPLRICDEGQEAGRRYTIPQIRRRLSSASGRTSSGQGSTRREQPPRSVHA